MCERPLSAEGFSKKKDRSFQDYHYFENLRDRCENHIKRHLERHGFKEQAEKFSLKSLEEQGIDREPSGQTSRAGTDRQAGRRKKPRRGKRRATVTARTRISPRSGLSEGRRKEADNAGFSQRRGTPARPQEYAALRAIGKRKTAIIPAPIRAALDRADRNNPRAAQAPDYRAAPLVEKREKGRYQTTAPPHVQKETENRQRRFTVAASEAHDHRSKNMGGLSCL